MNSKSNATVVRSWTPTLKHYDYTVSAFNPRPPAPPPPLPDQQDTKSTPFIAFGAQQLIILLGQKLISTFNHIWYDLKHNNE